MFLSYSYKFCAHSNHVLYIHNAQVDILLGHQHKKELNFKSVAPYICIYSHCFGSLRSDLKKYPQNVLRKLRQIPFFVILVSDLSSDGGDDEKVSSMLTSEPQYDFPIGNNLDSEQFNSSGGGVISCLQ